mmetsp:Transcript_10838/g.15869  ORF Transcript_10838/g.15869 Transcript_10838/m.15869 type:complete len:291 (-) Transcript_10838:552-1424(-)
MVAQELCDLVAIRRILVHSKLEVFAECLVEFLVCVLILGKIVEHFNTFLHKILLNDTQDLVLLQGLTRYIKRKILRVDYSLNKLKPLGHDILTVVHDENPAHIKLDVVKLLFRSSFEHIKWSTLGGKEDSLKLKLTFHREMLYGSMLLPVIRNRFVERNILILGNIVSLPHPDGLQTVEVIPFVTDLLDLFHLLLFLRLVLVNFLHFRFVVVVILVFILIFIIGYLLLCGLLGVKHDRKSNKLGVCLHQVLHTLLFKIFRHVLLQVKADASSTPHWGIVNLCNAERPSCF